MEIHNFLDPIERITKRAKLSNKISSPTCDKPIYKSISISETNGGFTQFPKKILKRANSFEPHPRELFLVYMYYHYFAGSTTRGGPQLIDYFFIIFLQKKSNSKKIIKN